MRLDSDFRRLSVVMLLICGSGCRTKVPPLTSDVRIADKTAERQLIAGFHELEGDTYRWTKHRFAVILAVPPGASAKGAILQLKLYIPDSQIEKLGPMTLKANVKDRELPSDTFSKGGLYTYEQAIPPELLSDRACSVVFTFDKSVREGGNDGRELSAVVHEVSLKESEPAKEHKRS